MRNAHAFAKNRAVDDSTSSTTTRSFSASVVPVAVMSTMRSAMPVSGASSMLPCSFTISTSRPWRAKWAAVMPGYFVATRMEPSSR